MVREKSEKEKDMFWRTAEEFGEKIKKLRIERGFGLREFARKVGVSPTYLSKMERGMDPPPSREIVIRMAKALEYDENELLRLAKKVPSDVEKAFTKSDVYARKIPEFCRTVAKADLSNSEWDKLIKEVQKQKKPKEE